MVLKSAGVLRDMFTGIDTIPAPGQSIGTWTSAGRRVTAEKATGLPPVLRGIRLYSETIASLPIVIYKGSPQIPDLSASIDTGPQYELLGTKPNALQTPFSFKAYAIASIFGYGNFFAVKAKSKGQVRELWPIDPRRVVVKTEGTELRYRVSVRSGEQPRTMDRSEILHIPGILLSEPYVGISPLVVAAQAMGTALATEEFAGRFFDNDATPSGILKFKGGANTAAANDTRETFQDRHRGAAKAHKMGALFGGAEYERIGVDAQAAQIIEAQQWTIPVSSNVLGLPQWALGGTDQNPRSTPEQRNAELLTFSLAPQLVNLEQGLHADDDLFPDKALCPHFLAEGLLRAEMVQRYASYTQGRQAGWLSINDIRKKENLPPIDGGDDYQVTPVGGAPNMQPSGTTDATSQPEPEETST